MKKTLFIPCILMLILASCHQKQEQKSIETPEPKEAVVLDGVYHFKLDGFDLWTLQDVQRKMSADLFKDAAGDTNLFVFLVTAFIGVNFLIEIIGNLVIDPVIYKSVRQLAPRIKKSKAAPQKQETTETTENESAESDQTVE